MTDDLLVVAPVLGRPGNAQGLADGLRDATDVSYRLVFVCSPGDALQLAACEATGADVIVTSWSPYTERGDYARKINLAFSRGREPWLFQAADDLRFEKGWDVAALDRAEKMGAGVVGTNDLGNPRVMSGKASTHSLIRRAYVDQDGGAWAQPGVVMYPGYWHNFCDEELVDLATARGEFAFERRSIVEHLHPAWSKAPNDATYRLGSKRFHDDGRLYRRRRHLWHAVYR